VEEAQAVLGIILERDIYLAYIGRFIANEEIVLEAIHLGVVLEFHKRGEPFVELVIQTGGYQVAPKADSIVQGVVIYPIVIQTQL